MLVNATSQNFSNDKNRDARYKVELRICLDRFAGLLLPK